MNKNQRENLQKAFISFHEQHVELTNVITAEDRPVIQVICRQCEWSEQVSAGDDLNLERRIANRRHFMFVQSKSTLRKGICPLCKGSNGVRKIIWGMPASEPDESKYYVGGCVSEDFNKEYKCIDCAWEG